MFINISNNCAPFPILAILSQHSNYSIHIRMFARSNECLNSAKFVWALAYPLPRIDATLNSLVGCKYFTTLDLASGYWQVALEESDKEKTAFSTSQGHYEFNVMPFGLTNPPATFQRLMECALAGLTNEKCLIYLDDIIVFSSTFSDHLKQL